MGGRVLSSPTFSCRPRVLHPRYQDIVEGCGVLDLDLGAQFVELEVSLQAPYNGKRAIQQITLSGIWRAGERVLGRVVLRIVPPISRYLPMTSFSTIAVQGDIKEISTKPTVFRFGKHTIAAESHRLALGLVPGALRYQRVT